MDCFMICTNKNLDKLCYDYVLRHDLYKNNNNNIKSKKERKILKIIFGIIAILIIIFVYYLLRKFNFIKNK